MTIIIIIISSLNVYLPSAVSSKGMKRFVHQSPRAYAQGFFQLPCELSAVMTTRDLGRLSQCQHRLNNNNNNNSHYATTRA